MSDLLESLRQSISCYVGKTVFVTNTDDNCILIKSDNYMNFILPLIQSFI